MTLMVTAIERRSLQAVTHRAAIAGTAAKARGRSLLALSNPPLSSPPRMLVAAHPNTIRGGMPRARRRVDARCFDWAVAGYCDLATYAATATFMNTSCVYECAHVADEAAVAAAAEETMSADTPSAFWTRARLGPMRTALVRAMRARLRARGIMTNGAAEASAEVAPPRVAYLSAWGRELEMALTATDATHSESMVAVLNLDDAFRGALEEAYAVAANPSPQPPACSLPPPSSAALTWQVRSGGGWRNHQLAAFRRARMDVSEPCIQLAT